MRWVTVHDRTLLVREQSIQDTAERPTQFNDWITRRAVHELLFDPSLGHAASLFPALFIVREALNATGTAGALAWLDATRTAYPPAIFGMGIAPDRLLLLRPQTADFVRTAIECLRCPGVSATIALIDAPLTRVQARRLQLAAEAGGGVGVLLRPNHARARPEVYAAATRWLVTPAPGERTIQRWRLDFVHGHGRHVGSSFLLEQHRATGQTHLVRPPAPLVHQPALSAAS